MSLSLCWKPLTASQSTTTPTSKPTPSTPSSSRRTVYFLLGFAVSGILGFIQLERDVMAVSDVLNASVVAVSMNQKQQLSQLISRIDTIENELKALKMQSENAAPQESLPQTPESTSNDSESAASWSVPQTHLHQTWSTTNSVFCSTIGYSKAISGLVLWSEKTSESETCHMSQHFSILV